jgi:hypothetical protein
MQLLQRPTRFGGTRGLSPNRVRPGHVPKYSQVRVEHTMSTEIPPTDPTVPVAPAPKSGPVQPDNWYNDAAAEVPADGLLTGKPTAKPATADAAEPDNVYTDGEPAS